MTNDDKKEFGRMWRTVRAEYGHECTSEGLKLAFSLLSRFSIEQVKAGVAMHMSDTISGRFKIQASDVIAHIEGRGDERAGAAWSKLQSGISGVGCWDDALFDDQIIHAIVDNEGGWVKVCLMSDNDMRYFQNRFTKQYIQYVSKSGVFDFPRTLTGTINADRSSRGLPLREPSIIGDKQKCIEVYNRGGDAKIKIDRAPQISKLLKLTKDIKNDRP